jgi:CBS domain
MRRTGKTRLYVVSDDGRLVGVLSLRDFLEVLTLKMELEARTGPGPLKAAKPRGGSEAPQHR